VVHTTVRSRWSRSSPTASIRSAGSPLLAVAPSDDTRPGVVCRGHELTKPTGTPPKTWEFLVQSRDWSPRTACSFHELARPRSSEREGRNTPATAPVALSREELTSAVHDNLEHLRLDRLDVMNLRIGGVDPSHSRFDRGTVHGPRGVAAARPDSAFARRSPPPTLNCRLTRPTISTESAPAHSRSAIALTNHDIVRRSGGSSGIQTRVLALRGRVSRSAATRTYARVATGGCHRALEFNRYRVLVPAVARGRVPDCRTCRRRAWWFRSSSCLLVGSCRTRVGLRRMSRHSVREGARVQ
jgi:hypothetical protein